MPFSLNRSAGRKRQCAHAGTHVRLRRGCSNAELQGSGAGIGLTSGERYVVNYISNSIFNARIDGANVTTLEVMMNVVSRASGENSQIQTILHVTQNANGEITTQFQNFHVHCTG